MANTQAQPVTREEVDQYLDEDGLLGRTAPPTRWSDGNPWLETATMLLVRLLRRERRPEDRARLVESERRCSEGAHGLINKNSGRTDEITLDEIKGYVAAGRAVGYDTAVRVLDVAVKHGWNLTNTGKIYYTAIVRPWDRAAYYLAAGQDCPVYELLALYLWMAWKLIDLANAGGTRLTWVTFCTIRGKNLVADVLMNLWARRFSAVWGTLARLFVAVYNNENHLQVRHAQAAGDALWPVEFSS